MDTPICDFVEKYASSSPVRLHMPGHKGADDMSRLDITEIDGADVLYSGKGIIAQSQKNASSIFGTAKTLYSTEGSSLAIRAILYLIVMLAGSRGERACILAGRNAHKVFVSTAALLGADVEWIYPENGGYLQCDVSADRLERILCSMEKAPTAVYITSPDYTGNVADIEALSLVCRRHGVLLAVDNAHGAYLRFLEQDLHPITLGADMCCDSAHKTLNALTGSAYLHISHFAPDVIKQSCEQAMALFASTSPSYIIMQSLDALNAQLENGFAEKLSQAAQKVRSVSEFLCTRGFELHSDEPLKITVGAKSYGYTGDEISAILRKNGIFAEFSDPDYLVMMFSPFNPDADFEKVRAVFSSIPQKTKITGAPPACCKAQRAVPLNTAILSAGEQINVNEAVGRVLAGVTVACPPAVPVLVCGELITEQAVKAFDYYGIKTVSVIK